MDFYTIDDDYLDYLRQFEEHIYYTKGNKANRKFVGIVFKINLIEYYAPLTHVTNKQFDSDFIIYNNNNEKIATIKLNNMIPIIDKNLVNKVDILITKNDTEREAKYKSLLNKEKKFIEKNISIIINKAKNVYKNYANNKAIFNFKLLEEKAKLYISK